MADRSKHQSVQCQTPSTFGHEWTRTTQTGYQREMTVDPYLPALETKVSKLLPSDSDCDTEQQQRMRWELRTAKRRYAETLGRILEQLKGGRESGAEPTHGLPAGVCVSPSFLNGLWHWTVRDAVTNAVIEFGTEPTELAAVRMAWEAYDRSTADDTSIVERRAN